jgi:N-glycosylase/DNA lyase
VKHIFRLDDELGDFYHLVKSFDEFSWIAKAGAGRMLRSATVFEDLVKTMCTTNCSWALTDKMVSRLVSTLGESGANGAKTFPTAEAMAEVSEKFYRKEIRAGYRSPYFVELARRVSKGDLQPENWLNSDLPAVELKKELKSVKGVGNYAAENLLKLLGKYEGLALDSWLRSQFYKIHNQGKRCSDKRIEKFYRRFGEWNGLAFWCDMTKSWLDVS